MNWLKPDFNNILPELKAVPNWVLAKPVMRDGKLTKPPYQPNHKSASHSDPSTWSSFDDVRETFENGGYIGVGFVLDGKPHFNGKYLIGFDWDKCVTDEEFHEGVKEQIQTLGLSRVEASISNTGIRGFFLCDEPLQSRRTVIDGRSVELYSDKRYLTTTGIGLGDLSREANVNEILGLFPEKSNSTTVATVQSKLIAKQSLVDKAILDSIVSIIKDQEPGLWAGKWQKLDGDPMGLGYESQSDADLSLAASITRACVKKGVPADQLQNMIEAVFGLSGLAKRDKWQCRQDYRARTIAKALEGSNKWADADASHGDIRNARVFAKLWQGKLVYVANAGKWLRWTNQRWSWCHKEEEMTCAKTAVQVLLQIAQTKLTEDQDKGKRLMQHALASHNLPRVQAMVTLARSESGMAATINELDSDPWLLGVRNGVIDLRTGALLQNDPTILITRYCNAVHNVGVRCPQWLLFLDQIFENDIATIETIQKALGYTLTGVVTEEMMFICFGYGSNGKSVFNNVIATILGDYGRMAPPSLLTMRRSDDTGARNDLAALAGSRYVSINELQAGDRLDEMIVKQLAGREVITARFLHKEFFEFMPTFKPWLRTNHKPIITGDDDGIWRRLVLIPFRKNFTGREKDPYLEQKLLDERDGILMWMVEGALKWRKDGLKLSATVKAEVSGYRKESDLLGEFLNDYRTDALNVRIEQSYLFNQWKNWCNENGVRYSAKASFTRRLAERGYKEVKSNGQRFYSGLVQGGANSPS